MDNTIKEFSSYERTGCFTSDYELWSLFFYTYRKVSYARAKQLKKYGLSHEAIATLWVIHRLNNNTTPTEIARVRLRKPQTITANIDRMVKRGLVVKVRDEHKKNSFRVSMTDKGMKAFKNSLDIQLYHKLTSELSEKKRIFLKECLEDILKSIR
jgi:DNA-binding MarR family transcriptional regulator